MSRPNFNNPIDRREPAHELQDGHPGPYLAKVIQTVDPQYMGKIRVQIMHVGSSGKTVEGELAWASYMSPFFGSTSAGYLGLNADGKSAYDDTQKSYGMWVPTPDIGTQVIVMFVEGMANKGYWFGCVPDTYKNFMVPGIAATNLNTDYLNTARVPVAEYNSKLNTKAGDMVSNAVKPVHPYIFNALKNQGLINDDIRGITTSSARRESPSKVWGVSTPGPVDKKGPVGEIGSSDSTGGLKKAAHSKLGGSTFVMDDGDEKFIRNAPASNSPPIYNPLVKDTPPTGDVTIPHNELIRLRTRTGHQILLHNSEDLIYIGNARGTAWIELTSNGKIDIYSADSISIHTENDLNITADRDINFEAGRNINMKSVKFHAETLDNLELVVGKDGYITTTGNLNVNTTGNNVLTAKGNTDIKSAGHHAENAAGKIYMNSTSVTASSASSATTLATNMLPDRNATGAKRTSILRRIPTVEPWEHHENLDPQQFIPTNTDIVNSITVAFKTPDFYENYTAPSDTFRQGRS